MSSVRMERAGREYLKEHGGLEQAVHRAYHDFGDLAARGACRRPESRRWSSLPLWRRPQETSGPAGLEFRMRPQNLLLNRVP